MPEHFRERLLPVISSFGRRSLCAAAVATLFLADAHAVGLGKITVYSSLGQPLQAEIELTPQSQTEADALKVKLASPDAFQQANITFNPALFSLNFATLQRGGRHFIRVTSSQPINEPFVDMLIDVSGSASHIVREYTFLLDPPGMRQAQPAQTETATASGAGRAAVTSPAASAAPAASSMAITPSRQPEAGRARPARSAAPVKPRGAIADNAAASTVKVERGDTLGRIAGEVIPAGVSLDQMLVALQRANPTAFVDGNINRLRAGQILKVPSEQAARSISSTEAHSIVVAQAADFNAYRSRLAGQVGTADHAPAESARQSASGKVTARVQEQPGAVSESKDKLKLSRAGAASANGGKAGAPSAEERIASEKALAEANARVAELEKNVGDLQKLLELKNKGMADRQNQASAAANGSAAPAAPASAASAQPPAGGGSSSPAAAAASTALPSSGASPASTSAPGAASAGSAPAPVAKPPSASAAKPAAGAAKKHIPIPAPEPSFLDDLLANPLLLPVAGVILALLGVLGIRSARRRKAAQAMSDSTMGDESALKTNSLFGSTGGQSVDTNNSVFSSGFAPSASQLDTNEVDPVAEADVYIAYGRDAQAEEILKEALRTQPERHAIRTKLLEIYSQRKDIRGFETMATELYSLTKGEGEEWQHAAVLGHGLDPKNPLYASAAKQASGASAAAAAGLAPSPSLDELDLDALLNTTQTSVPGDDANDDLSSAAAVAASAAPAGLMSGLGADSHAQAENSTRVAPVPVPAITPTLAPPPAAPKAGLSAEPVAPLDFEFDLSSLGGSKETAEAKSADRIPELDIPSNTIEFDTTGEAPTPTPSVPEQHASAAPLDFLAPESPATPTLAPAPLAQSGAAPEPVPLDFDLSDITLDLSATDPGAQAEAEPVAAGAIGGNAAELATKLDLAMAYDEIGDKEGARELLDEVVKGGHPELAQKARTVLEKMA